MTTIAEMLKAKLPLVKQTYETMYQEKKQKEETYTKAALESVLKVIQNKKNG